MGMARYNGRSPCDRLHILECWSEPHPTMFCAVPVFRSRRFHFHRVKKWRLWRKFFLILVSRCGWYVMFRRMWLYNNLAKLARPMRGESLGKVVLGAMVANFFLVLLYRFSRPLGNDIRVCGPLKVADQWDFKIAMGIINIIAVSVVLTLLIFFKHRRSSPTFDNIFKIASVCLISVICFELVLKPSKLQTALKPSS
ncbi:hypothetical protein BC829DRAFT_41912 [Chytridium lagenaria]|nr:hypothetical protein BC829DRAFT_41912 [Chytridium lagenaria]